MRVAASDGECGHAVDHATAAPADICRLSRSSAQHRQTGELASRGSEGAGTRIRRDCSHPRAAHVHGTRAAYVKDRCRCVDCTAANTAASRAASRARVFGRWRPFVDAAPVRDHVRALRAAGIGIQRIATLASIAPSHVRALTAPGRDGKPPIRRVRPATAQRVLRVRPEAAHQAPGARVDATGTRRRLQALIAIGWTEAQLAAQLHRSPSSLRRSMISSTITSQTASDVDAAYQRLWNTRPPQATEGQRAVADAARARAAARGWLPPLAWDDIDTDPDPDPGSRKPAPRVRLALSDEDVDRIAIERAIVGDGIRFDALTRTEQNKVIDHLTRHGRSIREIAYQLGTTKRTVSRHRASLRLP